MYLVYHCYSRNGNKRQQTELLFNSQKKAQDTYRYLISKYAKCFNRDVNLECLPEEMEFVDEKDINRVKISFLELMEYRHPTEEEMEIGKNIGLEDLAEYGYDVFDYDGTGMLFIEAIGDMWEMESIPCSLDAVKTGRYKVIPVRELPKHFPYRFYGWVDTSENRKKIEEYTEEYVKNFKYVPKFFNPFAKDESYYHLESCPFCNGRAILERSFRAFINAQTTRVAFVRCSECNARGPRFEIAKYGTSHNHSAEAEKLAVEAWNKRVKK